MAKPDERSGDDLERTYLRVAAGGNLLIGLVGLAASALAASQAILLDGLFNLTYFAAGLLTLKVAALLRRGDDQDFPFGYAYFEPLINGVKGLLVLGVTVMALIGAIEAMFAGGRAISADIAIAYGAFATVACLSMAFIVRRGARRTGSPLIRADAQNWLVNGAISSAVLIAFVFIALIEGTPLAPAIPYADPALVLIVSAISIGVPIRMAAKAVLELLNRAPDPKIVAEVKARIREGVADLPVQALYVRVVQPGRTRLIGAHIILPKDFHGETLGLLDDAHAKVTERLRALHPDSEVDLVFTANPERGAPARGPVGR